MKIYLDCIPCFIRQAVEASRMVTDDENKQQEIIKYVLKECENLDLTGTSPYMGKIIHKHVKHISGNKDPYKDIKKRFNKAAMEICEELELEKLIKNSDDSFEMATRIAIAGNIIDFGVSSHIDEEKIRKTINECIESEIKFNKPSELKEAVNKAKKILYLGDNCGEIVFDKLFIKYLPKDKITYVVKGEPIINDSTMEDAEYVGLTDIVRVIDNGADIPGTILEYSSEEFNKEFNEADLIISKGQGNYETLSEMDEKNIFFLLKAKCPVIAEDLECEVGDIVIKKS